MLVKLVEGAARYLNMGTNDCDNIDKKVETGDDCQQQVSGNLLMRSIFSHHDCVVLTEIRDGLCLVARLIGLEQHTKPHVLHAG